MSQLATKIVPCGDGSLLFQGRFAYRLVGGTLLLAGACAAAILAVILGDPLTPADFRTHSLLIVCPIGGSLLLGGLYLVSRHKSVRLRRQDLLVESGWLLGRRQRQFPLHEFAGLRLSAENVQTQDAATGAATAAGLLAAAVGGIGIVAWRNANMYCASLVRRNGSSSPAIELFRTMNAGQMEQMLNTLADRWDLKLPEDPTFASTDDFVDL